MAPFLYNCGYCDQLPFAIASFCQVNAAERSALHPYGEKREDTHRSGQRFFYATGRHDAVY